LRISKNSAYYGASIQQGKTQMATPKEFGPRLVDRMIELVEKKGLNNRELSEQFGVSLSWFWRVKNNKIKEPSANKVQDIIESLTGKPLLK
jgi:transcriptional regulator with XRE-family HTH domain